ncbi:CPBP family intramembrane glutamic endopeptidase [Neomoorella humiferrea]|uniref:CAAX amino terminal protease self-immunity n=1 Tax=Neomoorella humiferrea TaxID=676965 RepID=A0A2T0AJR9_9FIRM|nr:CPBP family intramembrane glutamic endopeptidase [Moorella humiferrea]PRR68597.1 CAAX amino terminal protease self- immunity [Moorella humiferrea]
MAGETEKIPWNLWQCLLVLLGMVTAGYGTALLVRFFAPGLAPAYRYLMVGLAQGAAVLGGLHYIVRVKNGLGLEAVGLKTTTVPRAITSGLGGGLVLFLLVILVGSLLQLFLPDQAPQPFTELVIHARRPSDLLIPLFLASFLAPVTEELYFRGFLFPVLKERYGLKKGLLGSGLIFALLHFDLVRFLPLTMGGVGLAYLYERTENIVAAIIAHATWNTIMIFLLYFALRWV